jgi:hypothetical protein
MSDVAFEQYAKQIDFMQIFQLEILRTRIEEALKKRQQDTEARNAADMALFEHFSGLGAGIDEDTERKTYFRK